MKMRLLMKRAGILFLFLAVGGSLCFWANIRTDGFDERKIYGDLLCEQSLELHKNSSENKEQRFGTILSQPFYYLGHGRQCYAFESLDGQYVIKFFNFSSHQRPSILGSLRLPVLEKIFIRKEQRGKAFFCGYAIDDLLKDQIPKITATLLVHLQPNGTSKEILLYDKWHQEHHIHLDQTVYVLQKKLSAFIPYLKEASLREDLFCLRLSSYVDLLFLRLERCILDPDGRLLDHIGLMDGSLAFFDHGRIFFDERLKDPLFFKEQMERDTCQMRKFLLREHPEMVKVLDEEIRKRLAKRS